MDDTQIVQLYFQRSESAISETAEKYGSYCMSVSMHILDSTPDAEECVNDTWLRAWNAIPPERPRELRPFLGAIVRRLSLDRLRSWHAAKRNRNLEVAMDELYEAAAVDESDLDELPALISEFLRGLPAEERRIFIQRYWYNLSAEQIAEDAGRSRGAVWTQLHRTRNKLKDFLTERGVKV